MKLHVVRTQWGLKPAHESDLELLRKIPIGEERAVEITMPRNLKFHRKFFGLLSIVFDNMQTPAIFKTATGQEIEIRSVDDLLWHIKMQLGHYEQKMTLGGKIIFEAKSISFAKMDNVAFEKFYNSAIDVILKYFLDCEKDELIEMVLLEFG